MTFHVHLYKNNFTPTVGSSVADFTECDFTGYAPVTSGSWTPPYLLPSGVVASDLTRMHFQGGNPLTVPNTVYGYYITDIADTDLYFAARFDVPINIAAPLAGLSFVPQINAPQAGWGP